MKDVKTLTSDSYQDYLINALQDPQHAAAYLTVHLEEKDSEAELLNLALNNVAEALVQQKMSSEEAKQHLEILKDLQSKKGTNAIYALANWLSALGLKLTVTAHQESPS